MAPKSSFDRLRGICADVGFDLERIRPSILARMRLLAETTETVNDCERAVRIANDVFRYYDVSKPLKRFTALERRIVVIGTIFADIGKSGPAGAALDGQQLVAGDVRRGADYGRKDFRRAVFRGVFSGGRGPPCSKIRSPRS
jgi:hypothetical protein